MCQSLVTVLCKQWLKLAFARFRHNDMDEVELETVVVRQQDIQEVLAVSGSGR